MRNSGSRRSLLLLAMLTLLPATRGMADASDWEIGRYLSKYPAMYVDTGLSYDARDSSFDAQGHRQPGAIPAYSADSRFPLTRLDTTLEWHFPLFETEAIPFISSRLWSARATLGVAKTKTEGQPLNNFIAANDLASKGDGLSDIRLAFGPVLWGSQDWRTRADTPFSVILLGLADLPLGSRDADAPNNIGNNVFAFGATLGTHLRPLPRLLLDAGFTYKTYLADEEPAFGAQTPHRRGDDRIVDATAALRLFGGVYAALSLNARSGAANEYERIRFSGHPPTPGLGMDGFPDPTPVRDQGTRETQLGLAVHAFVAPRLQVGLHYLHPLSGRSGEFDEPYEQQQHDCTATMNCNPQPNGSDHVDGLGPARAYASNVWMLSLNWNLKQGDPWLGDR